MLDINTKNTINCNGKLLNFSKPVVMGIVNVTPDSFFSGSRYNSEQEILQRVEQILAEGGEIIDVGAYSSRPGAAEVSVYEELKRLDFALSAINRNFEDIVISVDTFRAEVANEVVKNQNVAIINDISAGELDQKMFETIANLNTPYIMMHMQGTPASMQKNPTYENVVQDIIAFFTEKLKKLQHLGVNDVIIDPGFGFGKTVEHNFEILNRLQEFRLFGLPVLVGVSRKSMIYKTLNTNAENSLNGTTVLNTVALQNGANILRVHDVRQAVETVKLIEKLSGNC